MLDVDKGPMGPPGEKESLIIGKRVTYTTRDNYSKRVGKVLDKVKVALPSGINDYQIIDEYLIVQDDGTVDTTFPYFIESVI